MGNRRLDRVKEGRSSSAAALFELFDELGNDLEYVAYDAEIRVLEDWRFGIFVDRDDVFRSLHAGEMLHGARNSAGDINIRLYGLACLADLHRIGYPSGIDGSARGA